jgi:hypothetical protein
MSSQFASLPCGSGMYVHDYKQTFGLITAASVGVSFEIIYIVACIPVARQRPRNKQLYNGRYKAAAHKQQQRNGVFFSVHAEML